MNAYRKNTLVFAFLLVLALLLFCLNLWVGAVNLTLKDMILALAGRGDPDLAYIVLNYRMPRTVLCVLVGAGLAVSGLISQSILMNPLAAPDTLGISAGAAIGAVGAMAVLPPAAHGVLLTSAAAFAGGAVGAFAVYVLSYRGSLNPVRLALVGIAVSSCAETAVQLFLTKTDVNASTALLWLNGSLWGRTWDGVLQALPVMGIILPVAWMLGKVMDLIALGDEASRGLGLRLELLRIVLLAMAVLLASGSVAVVGMIGFVGLICPHIARRIVKGGHRAILPAAALTGANLLLLADTLGRSLMPPLEFPAGLVTSVIGAPYFLYLLWKESRRKSS